MQVSVTKTATLHKMLHASPLDHFSNSATKCSAVRSFHNNLIASGRDLSAVRNRQSPTIMSFRKRNVVIGTPSGQATPRQEKLLSLGTRPSPLDGRLTTSTGTASLDQLLAGHAGLPQGHSLLIEEASTTDFGGILLRYYTAEGLVQGHHVHVLGFDESWRRELPGLDLAASAKEEKKKAAAAPAADEKMKIAWRYETLGNRAPAGRGKPYDRLLT